uniref:PAZ domain-containing protein n=1 Tax=Glossina austeni TaxID=7395 RepID=A0A1A9UIJ2_GLOAU
MSTDNPFIKSCFTEYKQNEDPDNNQNKPPENPCQQQPLEKGPKAQIGNVGNVSQTGQRGGRSDQGKQQLLDDGQQKKRSAQLQHSGGDIRGRNDGQSGQPLQERQQFRSEQQKNVHWNKCQQEPRQEGGWEEPPKRQQLFTGQQDEQHRRQGSARSGQPQGGAVGVSQPQHQHFDRSQQGAWGGQKKQIYEDQQRPQPQQEGGWGYKKEAGGGQRHQTAGGTNRDRFGAQQQPSRQEGPRRCQPGQQQSPPQQDQQQQHQQQQHQGSGFAAVESAQQPYRQEGARRYQPGQQQSPPQQQQQQQQQQHKGSGFAAVESAQQPYRQEGARRCQPGQQQSPPQQQRQQQRQQQQYQGSGFAAEETAPAYNVVSCAGVQRGTLGRQGTCEVNYLRMNIDKMSDTAYHYDVTITPDRPKKFLRPAFDQCQRQYFSEYVMAFDGSKSCYSVIRLPDKSYDYEVEVMDSGDRQKSFQVQIKETDIPEVELASLRSYHNDRVFDKPMRALQALEVILASNNHALGIRVGRSFYRKPEEFYDLGDGYEMYTGIYQAAILGEVPLLNVDISHKSFPKTQSIIQYMRECGVDPNRSIEDNRVKKTITLFLKGIDIIYTPPAKFGTLPKKYKVFDIGDAPRQITFTLDDGKKTTVIDYFASKGCILQYPYLNCITAGSAIRKISLPMEFCSIAGDQVLNKRKDGNMQVSKMIKYSATSTNERKSKIMNLLAHFRHNENLTIRSFGIQFGSNFIKVHFRLLPPPELEYFGGKTARPRDGAWQLADVKFLETSKVNHGHKWAIIYENKGRPINAHSLEDFKKAVSVNKFIIYILC